MSENNDKKTIIQGAALPFGWGSLWLFTVGYANLTVGKALLALLIWPYYLGEALR